jgi:predicted extracellular nuclease
MQTIAFYNTENLFEPFSDLSICNDKKWTTNRYAEKLKNIGFTISSIGKAETNKYPAIIGLAEIENETVLQDLINSKHLKDCNYKFVFYRSKDERGINIGFLYNSTIFKVESSKPYSFELQDKYGNLEYTRDILLVSGILEGVKIHLLVNHWPSKRENDKITEPKRLTASKKVGEIISSIKIDDATANIIIMGDFNDNPTSKSVKQLVNAYELQNPFEALRTYSRGSTNHNRQWHLFDQILITNSIFNTGKNSLHLKSANIFDVTFLKNSEGKHKGIPNRTFQGTTYHGGFSDHFPVYITLG